MTGGENGHCEVYRARESIGRALRRRGKTLATGRLRHWRVADPVQEVADFSATQTDRLRRSFPWLPVSREPDILSVFLHRIPTTGQRGISCVGFPACERTPKLTGGSGF